MKRKYFLHRINAPMDADHVVYTLWVGESVREQRMLAELVAWSFKVGATLMTWSEDVDYYLTLEAERVFPNRGLLDFGFIHRQITAAEALEHVRANDWDIFEKTLPQPKGFFSVIRHSNPSKLDPKKSSIRSSIVLTEKSKNLSDSLENSRFIISFV